MANNSTKVLALAIKLAKATDSEKSVVELTRQNRDNQHDWNTSAIQAAKEVEAAQDTIAALGVDLTASAAQCMAADDRLVIALNRQTKIAELALARF
jgi:hypothetical protein|tara:strand:- start:17727 stop:18017 length:291 start_codon:yes stop_codon:yes gene_type:complete